MLEDVTSSVIFSSNYIFRHRPTFLNQFQTRLNWGFREYKAYINIYLNKMSRLHLAVRAYQELIQHVALLAASEDEILRDSAKIIKGKNI